MDQEMTLPDEATARPQDTESTKQPSPDIERREKTSQEHELEVEKERKRLRDVLLSGAEVLVGPQGRVNDNDVDPEQPSIHVRAITVPPGKLAAGFYWYERDPELYQGELQAMQRFFPGFQLQKLDDSRLAWYGMFHNPAIDSLTWYLQAIYDNNHPSNSTYGGSIKVYSVDPDLDELTAQLGGIPHTLRDPHGHIYICTARPEDFQATHQRSSTAAVALSWAAKWITVFELWMAGTVTTEEFASHIF